MAEREGSVIFRRDVRLAMTIGARHLDLGGATEPVVVSPDGRGVAWGPRLTFQSMKEQTEKFLSILRLGGPAQVISFPGHFPVCFAVSDLGDVLVICGKPGSAARQFLVFDSSSQEPQADLTNLPFAFPLSESTHISVSASGELCAIGSRERFAIISLRLRKVVYQTDGHSPQLAPSGERIAFVNKTLGFVIRHLEGSATQRMMPWARVPGIGGWSRDGRYLLVGVFSGFHLDESLLVVDTYKGNACTVAMLGLDDVADRFVWIGKALLSA